MSFGFAKGIDSIQHEIDEALNSNIIIFAAASNDGGNSGRAYPAWQDRVICIHSTDGYSNKSPYNPTPREDDNFSIVGQYINSAWPDVNQTGETRRMSGTSFATPVAAGLAALVLDWVSQVMPNVKTFIRLKSYNGMRRVFRLMSQERDPGYSYLCPFELFGQRPAVIRTAILAALHPTKH
jgi:Subtilase family